MIPCSSCNLQSCKQKPSLPPAAHSILKKSPREKEKAWKGGNGVRVQFQNQVFPEKVSYNGKKFGNGKLSLVYKGNEQFSADNSKLVTLYNHARTHFTNL